MPNLHIGLYTFILCTILLLCISFFLSCYCTILAHLHSFRALCTIPHAHLYSRTTHTFTRGIHTRTHTCCAHTALTIARTLRPSLAYTPRVHVCMCTRSGCIHPNDAYAFYQRSCRYTVWSVYQWCTHTFKKQRISYSSTENIYIYYTWQEM